MQRHVLPNREAELRAAAPGIPSIEIVAGVDAKGKLAPGEPGTLDPDAAAQQRYVVGGALHIRESACRCPGSRWHAQLEPGRVTEQEDIIVGSLFHPKVPDGMPGLR